MGPTPTDPAPRVLFRAVPVETIIPDEVVHTTDDDSQSLMAVDEEMPTLPTPAIPPGPASPPSEWTTLQIAL